jgi:2-(1,2-epoxy-1,2-dihydrophenyl)acetyl-CoA isomerase
MMSDEKTVLYEVANGVAKITLNRPDRYNAFTEAMLTELGQTLKAAARDDNARAVVLSGAGRGFCAGADLGRFTTGPVSDNFVYDYLMTYYLPAIKSMRTMEKPIIGAIHGSAAGAGAAVALACDLRIMAEEANITLAFSNIGLVPDAGSTWFLVRQVGYSRAFEIAAEGEKIPARRCLELGLTNRIVPAASLLDEAMAWAEKLAQRPTYALGLTKRAMNHSLTMDLFEAIEYEAHMQQLAIVSEDHREGVTAFMEKRSPVFKGR